MMYRERAFKTTSPGSNATPRLLYGIKSKQLGKFSNPLRNDMLQEAHHKHSALAYGNKAVDTFRLA